MTVKSEGSYKMRSVNATGLQPRGAINSVVERRPERAWRAQKMSAVSPGSGYNVAKEPSRKEKEEIC